MDGRYKRKCVSFEVASNVYTARLGNPMSVIGQAEETSASLTLRRRALLNGGNPLKGSAVSLSGGTLSAFAHGGNSQDRNASPTQLLHRNATVSLLALLNN